MDYATNLYLKPALQLVRLKLKDGAESAIDEVIHWGFAMTRRS